MSPPSPPLSNKHKEINILETRNLVTECKKGLGIQAKVRYVGNDELIELFCIPQIYQNCKQTRFGWQLKEAPSYEYFFEQFSKPIIIHFLQTDSILWWKKSHVVISLFLFKELWILMFII